MRTATIDVRSSKDLGRKALRIPIGIAIKSHRIMPPMTSDAVSGAAFPTIVFTSSRFTNERPRFGVFRCGPPLKPTGISRPRNQAYWTYSGRSVPRTCATRATSAAVHALPHACLAGSDGIRKKSEKLITVTPRNSTTAQSRRRMR